MVLPRDDVMAQIDRLLRKKDHQDNVTHVNIKQEPGVDKVTTTATASAEQKRGAGRDENCFMERFNVKIQDIKDLLEGKLEPIETTEEVDNDIDNSLIMKIELLKNKVKTINFSKETENKTKQTSPTSCVIEKANENQSIYLEHNIATKCVKVEREEEETTNIQRNPTKEKKWSDGSYFKCKTCSHLYWGRKHFYEHLGRVHMVSLAMSQLGEFASSYEEQEYQCRVCLAGLPHERPAISKHMASRHGLTMLQYETEHENTQQPATTLEKLPEKSVGEKENEPLKKVPKETTNKEIRTEPKGNTAAVLGCPVAGCTFTTTRAGLRDQRAALHLKLAHGLGAKDMRPGMYRFHKVKQTG